MTDFHFKPGRPRLILATDSKGRFVAFLSREQISGVCTNVAITHSRIRAAAWWLFFWPRTEIHE